MESDIHEKIRQLIQEAGEILVLSHIRPDGDAVGSVLGLGLALQEAEKQVQMVLVDGVPSSFRKLPGANQITRKVQDPFDLSIVLDISDLSRTGNVLDGQVPDLNIDHHITNLNFARINFVDPEAPATAAILAEYLPRWGLKISEPVAQALLNGIVSDTLGFRTSNVRPNTLRLAADLMEKGADLSELYNRALIRRSFEAARLWGLGLDKLQRDDRLVWTTLTLSDRAQSAYPGNDDADLINIIASIDESDIGIIFVEQKDNHIKVSWRAQPDWDISQLATQFGGGGHPAAAGADIPGMLDEVQEKVISATRQLLKNGANGNKSSHYLKPN
ncbi:MAG TPA: bifunctional oligoribonuclease/PAP phosphatase NrnA [Anaerolineaceae bacterium]|nr:bifunctional oligoribonuclease/PAP phosphatase NrnA [Anaerolineaceae bacterium]